MIREIVIVSGKGGTGKTSLTASFASLAEDAVFCDADVDAADLHLLFSPQIEQTHPFMGGGVAVIESEKCISCGTCRSVCHFSAISADFVVDPVACEGCGVCVDFCPQKAIAFPVQQCGDWFISTCRFGPMVHARLGIAEENSGKLVSLVRKEVRNLAEQRGRELIITDGPPGIGCPVIAAIGGASVLVIIVEPTVSGLHDMQRVTELAKHFRVPGLVIVNKADLNLVMTRKIEEWAAAEGLTLLGRIPFDPAFVEAMVAAQNIVEYAPDSPAATAVKEIWQKIIADSAFGKRQEIADWRKPA